MGPKKRSDVPSSDQHLVTAENTLASKSPMPPVQTPGASTPRPIRRKTQISKPWISPAMKVVIFTLIATGIAVFYWKPKVASPHFDQTMPIATPSLPYKVMDIPGKGKGMIATRNIRRGELLLREKPLFLIPRSINSSPTELIQNILSTLPSEGRAAFDGMAAAEPNVSPELSKVQTNAIAAGPDNTGIFPTTARLNHGCSSAFNVVYSWREDEKALVVYAVRDVKAGDELLTTYTDTKKPRHERRSYLSQNYHFGCTCAVCSLPHDLSIASDGRLSTITTLYGKLRSWASGEIDGVDAITTVKRIWSLMDEEGYMSERGILAWDAAHIAAAHSDARAVRAWCLLADEWFGYELGMDSQQAQNARELVMHPRSHRAWATRSTMKVGGP